LRIDQGAFLKPPTVDAIPDEAVHRNNLGRQLIRPVPDGSMKHVKQALGADIAVPGVPRRRPYQTSIVFFREADTRLHPCTFREKSHAFQREP
jgi:hypothetical protein